jgi:hypothetical protein
LIEALLPGMLEPSGWWDKVARPAFAANPLVLFSPLELAENVD